MVTAEERQAIRQIHEPYTKRSGDVVCYTCNVSAPCPVLRLMESHEELRRDLALALAWLKAVRDGPPDPPLAPPRPGRGEE